MPHGPLDERVRLDDVTSCHRAMHVVVPVIEMGLARTLNTEVLVGALWPV